VPLADFAHRNRARRQEQIQAKDREDGEGTARRPVARFVVVVAHTIDPVRFAARPPAPRQGSP
jgi:hypothetical protein